MYPPKRLVSSAVLLLALPSIAQFSLPRTIDHTQVDRPYGIAIGDVDLDGDEDVVSMTYDGSGPIWFPNRGDATYYPRRGVPDQVTYSDFHLVDLDRDDDLDIVAVNAFPGQLGWYENDGSGNFAPNQVISALVPEGKDVYAVDLDGDEDLDILTASYGNNLIAWYRNLGNMVFGPQQSVATMTGAYCVRAADLDGDGDQDVVAGGQGATNQAWYRNDGSGVFTPVPVADPGYAGFGTTEVYDVNNDGFLDVVGQSTGAGWTRWYANDGTGQFAAGVTMMTGVQPVDFSMADLDADGDLDLLTCDGTRLRWWTNDGGGIFSAPVILVNGLDAWGVDSGDLNGDGIVDVAGCIYDQSMVVSVMGSGGGSFLPHYTIASEADAHRSIITADLDGDGRKEVVTAVENEDKVTWFKELPDGNWDNEHVVTTLAYEASCVRAADMDGDGDIDLVSAGSHSGSTGHIAWYANDGSGGFGPQQLLTSGFNHGRMIGIGDMDGDGDIDIVGGASSQTLIFFNDGAGNFTQGPQVAAGAPRKLALADLDADGDLDIMTGAFNVAIHLNQGDGTFQQAANFVTTPNEVLGIVALDVDEDGDIEPAWITDTGNTIHVRWNNGDGTFDPGNVQLLLDFSVTNVAVGDIDGNGLEDILFAAGSSVRWVRHLEGTDWSQQALVLNETGSGRCLHLSDLDDDGDLDLLHGSAQSGKLAWQENYHLSAHRFGGVVFLDVNSDGVRDVNEIGLSGLPLQITPSIPGLFSLADGAYAAHTDLGTHSMSANVDPLLWTITTPDPRTVELTDADPVVLGVDVGVSAAVDVTALYPTVTLSPAVCGANTTLWVSLANLGTRVEQCSLQLWIDPLFTYVGSEPQPDVINGNLVEWELDPLPPFATVTIPIQVVMPSASSIGSPFLHVATVNNYGVQGQLLGEYEGKLLDTLACSYDPNDKLIDPRGYGVHGALELGRDTLDYTIRFQNTGNAPALTVMLSDVLDPILDPTRIQLLGHSHPITLMRVESDDELMIRFDDIQLPGVNVDPTGSQGFVRFRIRPVEGLTEHLSTARNTAGIYFDLNEPIITNTTLTTWVDCDLWHPTIMLEEVDSLVATNGDAWQWFLNGDTIPGANAGTLVAIESGSYVVRVRSEYGCLRDSEPITLMGTEVRRPAMTGVVVCPNPFSAGAHLLFDEPINSTDHIVLRDIQGRTVRSWTGTGTKEFWLPGEGLSAGSYLLHLIRTDGRWGQIRVVVQ